MAAAGIWTSIASCGKNVPPYQSGQFGAVFGLGKTCLRICCGLLLERGGLCRVVIKLKIVNRKMILEWVGLFWDVCSWRRVGANEGLT